MLDFLNTVSQAAGPIQQILGAIAGNKKPKMQPMPENEAYSISLLKALADPNNSYVQSLADKEFQNLRASQESDIQSKVLADRREAAMGRAPVYFDPERADENINYQITRGTRLLQQQAQQNAIQRILQAAGVGNFASQDSQRTQNYYAALGENAKGNLAQGGITGRIGQGTDALSQILKIFQSNQQPYGPPTSLYNQVRYNG